MDKWVRRHEGTLITSVWDVSRFPRPGLDPPLKMLPPDLHPLGHFLAGQASKKPTRPRLAQKLGNGKRDRGFRARL